ncbi:hypothetical protein V6N12_040338 [Hibiscus sabdariffa]|uniref:Uncharacterized protein n=1 Tax=Hibiscus sabdariffa TaxID=183260 RepID=A0ABR2E3F5_9ROSI
MRKLKHVMVFEVQMPGMLDWFGWCAWDAFHSDINPQGTKEGLMRSISTNFSGNSIICRMAQSTDSIYQYSLHDHDAAEFHAVARAVGGCGVYVSDKPGGHDFLVDQAKHAGRLSRDCLFTDPVMDGKSLLKIWNLNKCTELSTSSIAKESGQGLPSTELSGVWTDLSRLR